MWTDGGFLLQLPQTEAILIKKLQEYGVEVQRDSELISIQDKGDVVEV